MRAQYPAVASSNNQSSSFNSGLSRHPAPQNPASHFDSDSDYGYDPPQNRSREHNRDLATQRQHKQEQSSSLDSGSESVDEARYKSKDSDDSDDMPLAQRIPTALQAQKSLRKQSREQRNKRQQGRKPELKSSQPLVRPQSSNSRPAPGVAPDDLTRRLLEVQLKAPTDAPGSHPSSPNAYQTRHEAKLAFPSDRRQEISSHQPSIRRPREPAEQELLASGRQRLQSEHKLTNNAPTRARTLTERRAPAIQENIRRKLGTVSGPHASHQTVPHTPPVPPVHLRSPVERQIVPETPPIKSTPHRIYITDSQKSSTVNITATTRAKEILETVAAEGLFPADDMGGTRWMLWELDQDFGMGWSSPWGSISVCN